MYLGNNYTIKSDTYPIMKQPNRAAVRIRAWKKKIATVETGRKALQSELLNILSAESRYQKNSEMDDLINSDEEVLKAFEKKRERLLNAEHQQGFLWKPQFEWFNAFLSNYLPFLSWIFIKQPGSKLYAALSEEPKLHLYLTKEQLATEPKVQNVINTAEDYEQSLYENPEAALDDVRYRLSQLKSEVDPDSMNDLLNRLYALKQLVCPQIYQAIMNTLFMQKPFEAFTFFYTKYQLNQHSTPMPNDFIEHHMMARALLDLYVRRVNTLEEQENNENTDFLNLHLHSIQYLLILLSMRDYCNNTESMDLIPQLFKGEIPDQVYSNHASAIKETICNKQPQKDRENLNVVKLLNSTDNDESPRAVLVEIYKWLKPAKSDNPLLICFASLACEQLFIDYRKYSEEPSWHFHHEGYETIQFIAREIIETLGKNDRLILTLTEKGLHEDIANPENHFPTLFPRPVFHEAELFARRIMLESAPLLEGSNNIEALDYARKIRVELHPQLDEAVIDWILLRVRHINPDLLPALEHILRKIHIYDEQDFPDHYPVSPLKAIKDTPEQLLEKIDLNIEKAKEAQASLQANPENTAVKIVIDAFIALLKHPQLTSIHLKKAYEEILIKPFHENYFSKKLHKKLNQAIFEKQKELCIWTIETVPALDQAQTIDSRLLPALVSEQFELAQKTHETNFTKEFKHARLAVGYFAFLIQTPSPSAEALNDAYTVLPLLGKSYISPALNKRWEKHIFEKHAELCHWSLDRLKENKIAFNNKVPLLTQVLQYLNKAKLMAERKQLLEEYNYSKSAAQAFALFMEDPSANIEELDRARSCLILLYFYLTAEQYKDWSQQLKKCIAAAPVSLSNSGVHTLYSPTQSNHNASDTSGDRTYNNI